MIHERDLTLVVFGALVTSADEALDDEEERIAAADDHRQGQLDEERVHMRPRAQTGGRNEVDLESRNLKQNVELRHVLVPVQACTHAEISRQRAHLNRRMAELLFSRICQARSCVMMLMILAGST